MGWLIAVVLFLAKYVWSCGMKREHRAFQFALRLASTSTTTS